eukprot:7140892-Pyramimonas_sp.AAC.1
MPLACVAAKIDGTNRHCSTTRCPIMLPSSFERRLKITSSFVTHCICEIHKATFQAAHVARAVAI